MERADRIEKEGRDRTALAKRARLRVMHLLERRDYTETELRRKLKEGGYPPDIADEAIAYVKSYHYVDDGRYASAYVRLKQDSKSRRQMAMELQKKGVDRELIDQALSECEGSEGELIDRLLEKKHYDPDTADDREKRKVYQFLARRGFSNSDIRRAMHL